MRCPSETELPRCRRTLCRLTVETRVISLCCVAVSRSGWLAAYWPIGVEVGQARQLARACRSLQSTRARTQRWGEGRSTMNLAAAYWLILTRRRLAYCSIWRKGAWLLPGTIEWGSAESAACGPGFRFSWSPALTRQWALCSATVAGRCCGTTATAPEPRPWSDIAAARAASNQWHVRCCLLLVMVGRACRR
jgi:hypothetical protein